MIGIFSDEMFSDGTLSGGLFNDGQGWEFALIEFLGESLVFCEKIRE